MAVKACEAEEFFGVRFAKLDATSGGMLREEIVEVQVLTVFRPSWEGNVAGLGEPLGPFLGAKVIEQECAGIFR